MSICVDCHAHFLPDAFMDAMKQRGFAEAHKSEGYINVSDALTGYSRPHVRLPIFSQLWDIDERTALAEQQRIDRQIICLPPFYFGYKPDAKTGLEICRTGNDAIAATIAKSPERFAGFATVPLQSPKEAVVELRRAVNELGFWGVEIGTSVAGAPMDDPSLDVFWEICCELDVPIFVHPQHELALDRTAQWYLHNLYGNPSETALMVARLIFAGVFERFPKLNMILAHGGGTIPYIIGRLDHGYRVRPETKTIPKPPSAYLKHLYFDIITHDDDMLAYLVGRVGWRRVVVGTDRPFDMGVDDPREVIARIPGLSALEREAIVGDNARSFLSRSPHYAEAP
ncbi:MAG: amidohydrolase family protein [Candidatus Eremiobacteraeota bacterium]|nr:amidohydrolase family protein [Candidatus Eremiobacteraeota bacterium]